LVAAVGHGEAEEHENDEKRLEEIHFEWVVGYVECLLVEEGHVVGV